MAIKSIYQACVRCKGTGIGLKGIKPEDPCSFCGGDGMGDEVLRLNDDIISLLDDIKDKVYDNADKLADIWEKKKSK